jgi:two-component system, NarL family, response regulator DevR
VNTPSRLRVLLADPDLRVRKALRELLSAEPDLDICASVGTASAALEHVSTEPPDVVLMDVLLPDPADGLKLLAALQRLGLPAVVLTAASSLRGQAQQSDATAFLEKDGQVDGIASALRSASRQRQ